MNESKKGISAQQGEIYKTQKSSDVFQCQTLSKSQIINRVIKFTLIIGVFLKKGLLLFGLKF